MTKAGDVYNIASGVETNIAELASEINELCGGRAPVLIAPRRSWDRSGKRFGSTVKAERALGFRAKTPLHDGLSATVGWMRENLGWIERCIHRHDGFMEQLGVPVRA